MRIQTDLLAPVSVWASANYHRFRANGPARQYGILQEVGAPSEAWEIKRQIMVAYGLEGAEQEPIFKDFCGYSTQGAALHQHRDRDSNDKQHVRFNVLVSKPRRGGMPVLEGEELVIEEGDVWRCDASRVTHWATPVVGIKPRIVLSFGFLL